MNIQDIDYVSHPAPGEDFLSMSTWICTWCLAGAVATFRESDILVVVQAENCQICHYGATDTNG